MYIKHEVLYFNKWEKARREQNDLACGGIETSYKDIIKEMSKKINEENRVHNEFERYLKESAEVSFSILV